MKKFEKMFKTGCTLVLAVAMLASPLDVFADAIADEAKRCESFELGEGKKGALFLAYHQAEDVIKPEITEKLSDEFPETFDLRDKGVVTPVKLQNPFGTCWGFSAIAASETSILSAAGKTYEETGLDLSEHHLAYFTRTAIEDEEDPQYGEGVFMMYPDGNPFNTGGMFVTATSVLSSGIGPVYEKIVPYRGKNSLTMNALNVVNICYSDKDDWTLPIEYKFLQNYQMVESNILRDPSVYDTGIDVNEEEDVELRNEHYIGNDMAAIDGIKQELMNGHAVSIAFAADTSMPGQDPEDNDEPLCMCETEDGKWLHYTPDCRPLTHAVTIVGWDDTIKSTDFLDHSNDEGGDGLPHQPEGDGAFIVKNSWGAETNDFPHFSPWGNVVDGKHDGYFYLSYYDPTMCAPETFEYVPAENEEPYMIDQYDFMPADETTGWLADTGLMMSNIFTAEKDENIDSVTCQTFEAGMKVTYQVYKLDADSKSPTDGTLEASINETYDYAGYHRAFLPEPVFVEEGSCYSVVVTQTLEYDGKMYYGLCTSKNNNKEGTEKSIEEIKEKYPDEYKDRIENLCYYKGVVNPGESFVYIDELSDWYDFSGMIHTLDLNAEEKYAHDYDNFPIKAYCTFVNQEDIEAFEAEEMPELKFAEPAEQINLKGIRNLVIMALVAIIVLVVVIVLIVKKVKKVRRKKKALKEAADNATETAETSAPAESAETEETAGESEAPSNENEASNESEIRE